MTQKKIMEQVENDSKDELVVTEKLQDKELEAVVGGGKKRIHKDVEQEEKPQSNLYPC